MFEVGGYEFINKVRLQTEVPKIMMISLAESLGYNLSAIDGREDFNNYLSKNTFNGIEESINLSTGNSMYGYNFITNILANYPDVVQGDKNMKNLVVKNGLISFSFGLELWIPNRFFLELPNNRAEIKNEIYNSEENDRFKFNMVFNMDYIMPKIDSKHLINRKSFLPDVNVEYDVLDISSIINTEIDSVIKSMISKNLFSTEYFEIKIMCGNRLLRDMEYSVDYNNYIIKTYEPMSNTTYTILIYGDLEVLNNISKKLANKEDYSMIEKK
jgi:hypothetical protein